MINNNIKKKNFQNVLLNVNNVFKTNKENFNVQNVLKTLLEKFRIIANVNKGIIKMMQFHNNSVKSVLMIVKFVITP